MDGGSNTDVRVPPSVVVDDAVSTTIQKAAQPLYASRIKVHPKSVTGTFRTIKLEKRVEPGDARTTEIWLALDRGMLPVRLLVVEKDGTRTDQLATRIGS